MLRAAASIRERKTFIPAGCDKLRSSKCTVMERGSESSSEAAGAWVAAAIYVAVAAVFWLWWRWWAPQQGRRWARALGDRLRGGRQV